MSGPSDETVCSFCGMSHLLYGEMRKKERRIAELESLLDKATKEASKTSAEGAEAVGSRRTQADEEKTRTRRPMRRRGRCVRSLNRARLAKRRGRQSAVR
mmetsp:Transcript_7024/g.15472  ORF Transcript_7024/g.15472 Transcript_7024/m.15472 type:complete len:100 (+) Transcript_7024:332-631(+)